MLKFLDPILVVKLNQLVLKENPTILKPELLGNWNSSLPYLDSIYLQISCIVRSVVKNHYFSDGNKRTAVLVLVSCCREFNLKLPNKNIDNKILEIANNNYSIEKVSFLLFGK